ncbi:hypothetical protein HPB50_008104 [Hyalomma asiaticum]|uniref:Uncharacterized protein n=1 Tax=Hyalomma asiaticum TaxID=266040 RepID=A0ACB7S8P8_HYAAI|nr:hypothetical protein HPB50_008104 [Hyalomma asiaticum]
MLKPVKCSTDVATIRNPLDAVNINVRGLKALGQSELSGTALLIEFLTEVFTNDIFVRCCKRLSVLHKPDENESSETELRLLLGCLRQKAREKSGQQEPATSNKKNTLPSAKQVPWTRKVQCQEHGTQLVCPARGLYQATKRCCRPWNPCTRVSSQKYPLIYIRSFKCNEKAVIIDGEVQAILVPRSPLADLGVRWLPGALLCQRHHGGPGCLLDLDGLRHQFHPARE